MQGEWKQDIKQRYGSWDNENTNAKCLKVQKYQWFYYAWTLFNDYIERKIVN